MIEATFDRKTGKLIREIRYDSAEDVTAESYFESCMHSIVAHAVKLGYLQKPNEAPVINE